MKPIYSLAIAALTCALTIAMPYDVGAYIWVKLTVANNSSSPAPLPPLFISLPLNDTYQHSRLLNFTVRVKDRPVECGSQLVRGDCLSQSLEISCPVQLPPRSTAEVEVVTYVQAVRFKAPKLSYEASGRLTDVPSGLVDLTLPSGPWRYDHPLMRHLAEAASRTVGDEDRVLAIVAKLVDLIWRKVEYEVGKGPRYPHETLPPAKLVEGRGKGDCDDQANLLILMLRYLGVPAYLKTSLVADFNYGEERVVWAPEAHYYSAFYGVDYGHAWAEVYIPPWGWLPVDLTFHASTGDPLDAIRTSATSESWVWQTIVTVRVSNICHEDYIAEFRNWASETASTPFFYYWEYAVVKEGDSLSRVKSFLKPLPLPWVKDTSIEVYYPGKVKALQKLKIEGVLKPGVGNATVTLHVRKPSGRLVSVGAKTNLDGSWMVELTPDEAGAWSFNVTFQGSPQYAPSSREFTIYVEKLACALNFTVERVGNIIHVKGGLEHPVNTSITLLVSRPSGSHTSTIGVVNGLFNTSLPVDEPGAYLVRAYWVGNEVCESTAASAEVFVEYETEVVIKVSVKNNVAIVEGVLRPPVENSVIRLKATSGEVAVQSSIEVEEGGVFEGELELPEGLWVVTAIYEGKPGYKPSNATATVVISRQFPTFLPLLLALSAIVALLFILYARRTARVSKQRSSSDVSQGGGS